jgi:hypothetical protein
MLYADSSSFEYYISEQEKNLLKVMSNHPHCRSDGRITVVAQNSDCAKRTSKADR